MNSTKKATGAAQLIDRITRRQAYDTARDMADWRRAKREAKRIERPRRIRLVELLEELLHDTHLSSQVDLRIERSLERPYTIQDSSGVCDEERTRMLSALPAWGDLLKTLLMTPMWGHSVMEITPTGDDQLFTYTLIPRQHVVPQEGIILTDLSDDDGIHYRELREYGTSIIEVGAREDLGILFDCAPDTIYRMHAKASWSEFCEIYGIPPRILKMDTLDTEAFNRAVQMMQQMGAANWAIVDQTEELTFGTGVSDNGSIFQNLITAAEQSVSLKICGAVVGQDTLHGNRSKEESAQELLDSKCAADRRLLERYCNTIVLPALYKMGVLPDGLRLVYEGEDDTETLFQRTTQLLPHYEVDPEWIRERFGVEVTGRRETPLAPMLQASANGQQLTANCQELTANAEDPFFG